MGVPGLWDVLRPAGKVRSLTHLAVEDGFEANTNGNRGFRIGIDASIWFYHATYGREGENPELRTLFFRCSRLMGMPFLPLFVFDGDERPKEKRGKRISGKDHWMVQGMQSIIDAFGFEWYMAPGEAEAELAYLNRVGIIDGILSDDVDNFLFGAQMVIRNPGSNLSGNRTHALQNSAGAIDDQHVAIYKAKDLSTNPAIELTQGGLILIGILRGGDYHQAGLTGCGITIAHGLAKCGFGDSLCRAARSMSREQLEEFLEGWRDEVQEELRTNSKGLIGRKNPTLARSIPEDFPDVDIVLSYTHPITSETKGGVRASRFNWEKEPDIGKIAGLCELYFEWGVKETIIKRFRTVLWPSTVLRILRRSTLLRDKKRSSRSGDPCRPSTPDQRNPPSFGTPSKMIARHFSSSQSSAALSRHDSGSEDDEADNLVVKIHSSRTHASTDHVLEYRLEVAPAKLVELAERGIRGLRKEILRNSRTASEEEEENVQGDDEDSALPDPHAHLRVWIPACVVEAAEPSIVSAFKAHQLAKQQKKQGSKSGTRKKATSRAATPSSSAIQRRPDSDQDSDTEIATELPVLQIKPTKKASVAPALASVTEMEAPTTSKAGARQKARKVIKSTESSSQPTKARRNGIEDVFKTSKTGVNATKSKAAEVAALFADADWEVPPPKRRGEPQPLSASSSWSSQTQPSQPPSSSQPRPGSILSLLDDDLLPLMHPPSLTAKADSLTLRPFPLAIGHTPPPPPRTKTSTHMQRRSDRSDSDIDTDTSSLPPPRPRRRQSPPSERRERSPASGRFGSQSSARAGPILVDTAACDNTIIEISSGPDDSPPPVRSAPRKPVSLSATHSSAGGSKAVGRRTASDTHREGEVIDLT